MTVKKSVRDKKFCTKVRMARGLHARIEIELYCSGMHLYMGELLIILFMTSDYYEHKGSITP